MTANAIKVFIKVRPLIAREKNENSVSVWQTEGNTIKSIDKQYEMSFDHIYDETKCTQEIFEDLAKPIVTSALKGINGTIFAYGQTSSGKTYTMMGDESNPGIIPLIVSEIFTQIENTEEREFLLRIGYIEIYNERIFDLLAEGDKQCECTKLRELIAGEGCKPNQREIGATSEKEILGHYESGNRKRRFGETNMNERSSRSHTIFRITIESREVGKTSEETSVQVSNLNLVDLAGSERADQTRADGERLKEGGHINKSLLALGNVIRLLSDDNATASTHINYRDSKLTRILSASLGGNAMTSIICTVTPACLDETYYTLVFAQNAKKIKNKPEVNEVMTDQATMKKMQREIEELKNKLESRNTELNEERLKQAISDREAQFLHSHNVTTMKVVEMNRRRTWCPSSGHIPIAIFRKESCAAPPLFTESSERSSMPVDQEQVETDEIFTPGEEVNLDPLDRTLSPGQRNTDVLSNLILTPREMKKLRRLEESPNPLKLDSVETLLARNKYLEEEIQELSDFKKVETTTFDDHNKLSMKLSYVNDHNALLELKIEQLQEKVKELEDIVIEKESNIELKTAKAERLKALEEKKNAQDILNSIEYEFESFKVKAKKREGDLTRFLEQAWSESQTDIYQDRIKTLEEMLKKSEELIVSMQLQVQDTIQPDSLGGGDINLNLDLNNRIAELEANLQTSIEDRMKLQQQLKDKRDENARIMTEYDQTSSQLMEHIQENENLIKQVEHLTATKNEDIDSNQLNQQGSEELISRHHLMEEILYRIKNERDLPLMDNFGQDESIQTLMQLHENVVEWKQNESNLGNLILEVNVLRHENETLKNKLPTIQESCVESENEMLDKFDQLTLSHVDIKGQFEAEVTRRLELEELVKKLNSDIASSQDFLEHTKILNAAESQTDFENEQKKTIDDLENQVATGVQNRAELTAMVEKLQALLEEKINKIKELEDTLTSQENEMTTVVADLKDELKRIMSMGEDNVRLKVVEKEHKRLVNEFTARMGDFQTMIEETKAAKGLIEVQKQRIRELEANETNNKRKLEQLNDELTVKTEVATRSENEIVKITKKNEELIKSLEEASEFKELSDGFEIQLLESKQELARTQQELARILQLLSEKTQDNIMVSSNTSEEFEALIQEHQSETNKQVEELQEKISILEKELAQSKASENSSVQMIESLQKEIQEQAITISDQMSRLESELQKQEAFEVRMTQVNDNEQKLLDLEEELKESRLELELSAGELGAFRTKYEELQAQIVTKENSIKILESYIKDKNQELEELQNNMKQLSKNSKEVDNLKMQLTETEMQLTEIEKERDDLKKSLALSDSLKAELTSLKAEKSLRDEDYAAINKKTEALIVQGNEAKEQCKSLQQSFSRIDAENTNLKSKLVITEEEVKTLHERLKERTDECEAIKTRIRRRSKDNDKKLLNIEKENADLVQSVGAIEAEKSILDQEFQNLKSEYLQVIEQMPKLQAEVLHLKIASNENDMKYSVLDEKYSQLDERKQQLEILIEELKKQSKPQFNTIIKANDSLEREIQMLKQKLDEKTSDNLISLQTIVELRVERDNLMREIEAMKKLSTKKPASPDAREKRAVNELYVSRNEQLLLEGAPTPTRAVERNVERKNRRQSVHDEHRRLSVWERFTDSEAQTDAVSEICACSELTQKVKELQIEVRKKDMKLLNLDRLIQHHPLKLDVDELKKSLAREQRDHYQTKANLDTMTRNVKKLELKIEKTTSNKAIKRETVNTSSQTTEITVVNKSDFDTLENNLGEMKRLCRQHQERVVELERSASKENVSSNIVNKSHAVEKENAALKKKLQELEKKQAREQTDDVKASLKIEVDKLKAELVELEKKYDMTRRLCNLRNDDVTQLKKAVAQQKEQLFILESNLAVKNEDFRKLREKYDGVKQICNLRLDKLNALRSQMGESRTEDD